MVSTSTSCDRPGRWLRSASITWGAFPFLSPTRSLGSKRSGRGLIGTRTCLLPFETETDRAIEISTVGTGFSGSDGLLSFWATPEGLGLGEVGEVRLLAGDGTSFLCRGASTGVSDDSDRVDDA